MLSDFSGKLAILKEYITPTVLDLINRSETTKEMIRAYSMDDRTEFLRLDASADGRNSASYWTPSNEEKGYVTLGIDRLSSAAGLVQVLIHELGHHKVEGVGDALYNARNTTKGVSFN